MILIYTPTQTAVAQESWHFWRARLNDIHTTAWVANEDGETSFVDRPGDHGYAKGIFQWWPYRRADMLKGTGIDVATASHLDQLKAAYWEATQSAVYKSVWPLLLATKTLEDAIGVLVTDYERSANQARDVSRRLALGEYWLGYAQQNNWSV